MSKNYILILSALFTWGIGEGLFYYFQPLYLEQFDINPVLIGSILSISALSMALIQIPFGYLTDIFSARKIMWFGWTIGTVAVWLMALAKSLPLFIIGMVFYGFSAVAAATTHFTIQARGKLSIERALTLSSAAYNAGAIMGPILGGWIGENFGLNTIYRIAATILIGSTFISYFFRKPDNDFDVEENQNKGKFKLSPKFILLLGLFFVTYFSGYLAEPLTPNFLQNERGLSLSTIGQLGSIGSIGNTIILLVFGGLQALRGLPIAQAFVGFFVLLVWRGNSFPLYAAGFFLKGGFRIYQSMFTAIAHPIMNSGSKAVGYGYIATIIAMASVAAPTVAGILYSQKPEGIYVVAFILIISVFILNTLILPKITKPKSSHGVIEEPCELEKGI